MILGKEDENGHTVPERSIVCHVHGNCSYKINLNQVRQYCLSLLFTPNLAWNDIFSGLKKVVKSALPICTTISHQQF